jgi:hypothetical protein
MIMSAFFGGLDFTGTTIHPFVTYGESCSLASMSFIRLLGPWLVRPTDQHHQAFLL